jgi:hypothetical protein
VISEKVPVAVSDRNSKQLAGFHQVSEGRIVRFGAEKFVFAHILETDISQQRSGQKSGFGEYLESIADAENKATPFPEIGDGVHDRRKLCERAGAKIVAISESARKDNGVESTDGRVLVPDVLHRPTKH